VWIGRHDGASALALRLACQKVTVAVYNTIPHGHAATALLRDVRNGELINSSTTVLDVARVIAAEGDNGAVLARTNVLRKRLRKPMDPKSDLHRHHAAFVSTLRALTIIGRKPAHEVERIFIGTLPAEWRDVTFGPTIHACYSGMSTHCVLTSIVATVSSWRLITCPAVTKRAAYAVAEEGVGGAGASWCTRGPPTAADVVRGDAKPSVPGAAPARSAAPACSSSVPPQGRRSRVPDKAVKSQRRCFKCNGAQDDCLGASKHWKQCPRLPDAHKDASILRAYQADVLQFLPKKLAERLEKRAAPRGARLHQEPAGHRGRARGVRRSGRGGGRAAAAVDVGRMRR
jgi:hypothetical protein